MAAQTIKGFVQIWNPKTGMSKSKAAFIGTMEGQKKVRLVLYFKNGKYMTFLLTDNIQNVVFRSYRGNQNHLHLTFKNNKFLFVKGLSSTDAEMLRILLDRFHQKKVWPPVKPDKGGSVFSSTTPRKKINKTSFRKVGEKSSHKSFEKAKGSGTGVLQRMPLLKSESSALTCGKLLEKQNKKRKITLLSSSEMNEEFLEENNSVECKKSKLDCFRCVSYKQEKQLKLKELEEKKKLECESSCIVNSTVNPYLDDICLLQALTEKVILAFVLQPGYSEDYSKWDKLKLFFELFPERLCHGLPNLGNTCYMNAVLQSLFSIPSFANDILNRGFPWSKSPLNALTMSLARLLFFKDIYNIEVKEMLLLNIKKVMSAVAEVFHGNAQKDAHEFLGHCLDQLKDDNTEKHDTIWKPKSEVSEYHFPKQVFADDPDTNGFSCPVTTNFESELLHSIVCKACGQVILKTELSNYLSINLPQGRKAFPSPIQSTFDLYFAAEELEYKCAKLLCTRLSVGMHSFSRLPRVLIVHLKRYSLNEFCSLKKNDQEVIISKYLTVSSHCNEDTKPPLPLSEDADIMDFQELKVIRKMTAGSISVSWPSTKKSKDTLAAYIGSDKKSEQQKFQTVFKGASRRQQRKLLGKKFVYSGDRAFTGNKPLAYLMAYLEDVSLSQCHKAGDKPASSPDTCFPEALFPEAPFQAVPENPKQKKYAKMSMFAGFGRVFNPTKDFCEDKNISVPEGFQKVTEQTQNYDSKRICGQVPQQALPQSLPKPGAQGHTEKLIRSTKLNLQKPNRNSLHALGSNKNPRNKDILDQVKSKAKETEINANKGDHTYRLISVVSHLGKTLNSGHYICDAYDFEKQTWLTYNDMKVLSIQEAQMQKDRRSTGYIFFYMHNEIFEEMLKREQNAQLHGKEIEEILWKK
uniref:Ubiquitin carboxyl-terminal hydrolase n=1 Tax=Aotus nancymaae TaxID=37293 RepID=A0A2K5CQD4_AOTNA